MNLYRLDTLLRQRAFYTYATELYLKLIQTNVSDIQYGTSVNARSKQFPTALRFRNRNSEADSLFKRKLRVVRIVCPGAEST